MTTAPTPPAPDDGQAHDAARAIVAQVNLMSNTVGQAREIRAELTVAIAAALARERREVLERACRLVCRYCDNHYYNSAKKMDGKHWTHTGWDYAFKCDAAPIRAEMDKP